MKTAKKARYPLLGMTALLVCGACRHIEASTFPATGTDHPVLFYSGRNDNKDIYILQPGEKEPRNLTNHAAQDLCPAASPDGTSVLFLSDRGGNMDVFSMAPDGSGVRNLTASPETEQHPEFTPDGKRVLFVRDFEKRTEIWIMNADGSEARRLTHNEARDERPFLSPDGSNIIFMSNRDGNYEIYTMAPDGSRQTRLTDTPEWEIFPVWSPDGTKIAYSQKFRADGRMQGMVRVMNADGSGDRPVTAVETRDENAMWSPDGRHILLQSVRDGNFEVYQVDLDGGRPVRLTDHPAWDGWACYLPVRLPNAADDRRSTAQGVERTVPRTLNRGLEAGQAVIRYLFHSGWAVQTRNHLLIFDYTEPLPPPGRPAMSPRAIEPAEIVDQNVTVFISHSHSDHFNPEILKWRDAVKSMRYVWGWEGAGEPEDIHFGRERRVVEDRGLEILNVHHDFDGIPESAFLVKVDGLAIFFAGDHGSSRGLMNPVFGDNIRYLAGQAAELDLMFTPTFGGEIDAIRALKPKVVFPMHDGGRERQYAIFAEKVGSLGLNVRVGAAGASGARFLYIHGKLEMIEADGKPDRGLARGGERR